MKRFCLLFIMAFMSYLFVFAVDGIAINSRKDSVGIEHVLPANNSSVDGIILNSGQIINNIELLIPSLYSNGKAEERIEAVNLTYNVTINSIGNGKVEAYGVSVREGNHVFSVEEGNNLSFTCTPDAGYRVVKIREQKEGYIANESTYTDRESMVRSSSLYNVSGNYDVSVTFEKIPDSFPNYNVTVNSIGNGKVEAYGVSVREGNHVFSVEEGNNLSFTCTPDAGYRVVKIREQKEGYIANESTYTDRESMVRSSSLYNVSGNYDVSVTFEKIPVVSENRIYLTDATTAQNTTKQISVKLKNDSQITNFQFDVYLPTGVSMETSDGNYLFTKGSRLSSSHSITCAQQSDGAYRFFCYSASNALFSGNDGEIMNFTILVPSTTATGDYTITIKNAKVAEPNGNKYTTDETSAKLTVTQGSLPVSGITLNCASASLTIGETKLLTATITPSNATNKNVTWSSSNTSVATVNTVGAVSAVGVGIATITCTAADGSGKSATCAITVTGNLSGRNNVVTTNTVGASVTFSTSNTYEWEWDSSSSRMRSTNYHVHSTTSQTTMSINADKLTDFSFDYCISSESNYDKLTITLDETTIVDAISGLSSNSYSTTLSVGTHTLEIKYEKDHSDNSYDDRAYISNVSFVESTIPVNSITLNETALTLNVGDICSLTATVSPTNATNKNVTWSSSDTDVASVSTFGVITAIGTGNATIICTAADGSGITTSCSVIVNPIPDDNTPTDVSQYEDILYVKNAEVGTGRPAKLSIQLNNVKSLTGFQGDIVLPNGCSFVFDEYGYAEAELTEVRTNSRIMTFNTEVQEDGSLRLLAFSAKNIPFTGNDGEVATVSINVDSELPDGEYLIQLKNIILTDASGVAFKIDDVKSSLTVVSYILGDANGDKEVNVADLSTIAAHILGYPLANFVFKGADANEDNEINVADLSRTAGIILGTFPPKSPKRDLETEATFDMNLQLEPLSDNSYMLHVGSNNTNVLFSGFQFDLSLPKGLNFMTDDDGYAEVSLSMDRTNSQKTDHFDYCFMEDGSLRVLGASSHNAMFEGENGDIITLKIEADEDFDPQRVIALRNIIFTSVGESKIIADEEFNITNVISSIEKIDYSSILNVYDMNGRYVQQENDVQTHGMFIINGKKIIR